MSKSHSAQYDNCPVFRNYNSAIRLTQTAMLVMERQQEIEENGKLDDIDAYFTSTELLLDKSQNDQLFFWVKNDKKYPLLAPLAQDILVIPA